MSKIKARAGCLVLALSLLVSAACGRQEGNNIDPGEEPVAVGETREVEVTAEGAIDDMKFTTLPLGQVKAAGWLKTQLLQQAENVTKHFEELSPDCCAEGERRSGWLGGSGESWERGTYYVRGLVASAYVLDDAELKAQAQKWIEWTLESQTESGAFGPLANSPDSLDYWPLMPMLMALEFYCDATGDERVVPFLEKYFAWEAKALRRRPLYSWAEARGGDNIFAVYWLYERTGDEKLLDLCRLLYRQTYNWAVAYDAKAWSETYHIVNVQQSFKLFPLMYALTGDRRYLDVYYKGIENIYMASGRQDGMSNGDELTRGIDGVYGTETCAVVERMLCDEIALAVLRDATIADHLELISYNALPQQLLSDGRGQVYFTMQNQVAADMGNHGFTSDGGDRSVYGLPGGYPCCVHNYQMGWPLFVASMWFSTSDGGLAAGAYGPCLVTAEVGDGTRLTITQTTNYPFEDRITLTLAADKTDTYPIYIRVPEWCSAASVRVNGHPIEAVLRPGQYVRLFAGWHDGDVITLDFPAEISATLTDNNSVSIRRGAVLFALKIEERFEKIDYNPNHWNLKGDYPSYNITAASAWNYALENFNFNDAPSNFRLTRKKIKDDMRFQLSDVPMILEAKARTVSDWTLNAAQNIAGDTPISPVAEERLGQKAGVKLVPYAFTRLRITHIPWSGTPTDPEPTRPDDKSLLFESVIAPYEKRDVQEGTKKLTYTIDFIYETPCELSLALEIDRAPAGLVKLPEGSGSVSLATDLLRSDRHNRVLLTSADGSPIPGELSLTLRVTVEVVDTGAVRYEAETAWLTGSAYRSTRHVAGIDDVGSSLTFDKLEIPSDGEYTLRFYYAAALGPATHTVFIDGVKCGTVHYNENGKTLGWGCFDNDIYADFSLSLTAGTHKLRIEKTADDVGFAELDAFDLIRQ